ncbi:transporter substrate-binding domain-containing protein [Streptomyces glaucescens]|jgi:general L-amino acid transport system substrate-binding protein|uniref:transporter substrate-binding domain-containing protein n=1 Tax=Streptomyces glaucescens TaxID=1907 RepID=UPI000A3D3FDA|nr:transporter substrate-binding domain-containing protein [Streptomyces glaucescens]
MTARTALAGTLARVRARGAVRALVSQGQPGLSLRTPDGRWTGLDADVARAVAAAVAGDPEAVDWRPASPAERLTRLAAGEADLTVCNVSWTMGREAAHGLLFAGVTCYDGEGFLVPAASGVTDPAALAGHRVAVHAGSTTPANLAAWYGPRGLAVHPVAFDDPRRALHAYASGECAAYVLDKVALAGARRTLPDPAAHRILPAEISREPMAAVVRDDDPGWFRICRWVLQLLFAAEYETHRTGPGARAAVARQAGRHGPAAGLDTGWAARVLDAVGGYAELYERNLGRASGLDVPRGPNELWTRGGLHYAVPLH